MRINSNEEYACGFTMLELRKVLRRTQRMNFFADRVEMILNTTEEIACKFIQSMEKDGYVKQVEGRQGVKVYSNTIKGNAIALASASRPLKRETAERKINELLQRVKEVNLNDYYLYEVEEVRVFGSFLSSKERLSDVDIAVKLKHKIRDADEQKKADDLRLKCAIENGRVFYDLVDEMFWSQTEVLMFLKSRSKGLSLHVNHEEFLEQTESNIIYKK